MVKFTLRTGLFLLLCGLGACRPAEQPFQRVSGETMGTYYAVTLRAEGDWKPAFDSLLEAINLEVSTYIPASLISRFNRSDSALQVGSGEYAFGVGGHFAANFRAAAEMVKLTDAAFDPTVMPLVNYWGFGYTPKKPVTQVDSSVIDSLMRFVGFDKLEWRVDSAAGKLLIRKRDPRVQLDFSAIAKGYAVDALGALLESRGVRDFFIDIGGENLCRGSNPQGQDWRIGISTPDPDAPMDEVQQILQLTDKGIATSGNYRNFHRVDTLTYAHIIDPRTGFPEPRTLVSVTVLADDCMHADAAATALMVMGLGKGLAWVQGQPAYEALFISRGKDADWELTYSEGLRNFLPSEPIQVETH